MKATHQLQDSARCRRRNCNDNFVNASGTQKFFEYRQRAHAGADTGSSNDPRLPFIKNSDEAGTQAFSRDDPSKPLADLVRADDRDISRQPAGVHGRRAAPATTNRKPHRATTLVRAHIANQRREKLSEIFKIKKNTISTEMTSIRCFIVKLNTRSSPTPLSGS